VADLFLGSGSTLIACERTGRTCYGVEIDEMYATIILALGGIHRETAEKVP
jgi:DNA modification methylase